MNKSTSNDKIRMEIHNQKDRRRSQGLEDKINDYEKMNKSKQDLKISEISERIVDAILNERFLNKKNLLPMVESILKSWVNFKNKPLLKEPRTEKQKLVYTIHKEKLEHIYTRNKLRTLLSEEEMQQFFKDMEQFRIENNINSFDTYKNNLS